MGSLTTTDATTSLDTPPRHHDRRRPLSPVEYESAVEDEPSTGHDGGRTTDEDHSALSRIIEVRNGHRAMGQARGRLMQTSMIFQALLALALVLGIVAMVQYRTATAAGSPDAEPPSVLVQVSE